MLAAEAPKITDWMQAWGSLAGLVMSTAAVIFTGLLFRHEIRVRRDEQRDNEATQARLVVARPVTVKRNGERPDEITHVECLISNYSNMPVFNLMAHIQLISEPQFLDEQFGLFNVLQDEAAWNAELSRPVRDSELSESLLICVITFFDSSGVFWQREGINLPIRIIPSRRRFIRRLRILVPRWSRALKIWLRRLPENIRYRIKQATSRTPGG
ncbi:hypothetical protein ACFY2Q_27335 [Micromonospora sp. NPDC000316]|uniref:hypothetical protein n=1 Tax=Micromonospora sp. NPDC000316 TaxID=3364216 RepID=UPI00368BA02E